MRILTLFVVSSLFSYLVSAKELQGVDYPDTSKVGEHSLMLNGMGIRKATILRIKAYVSGLYVEKKSKKPEEIQAYKTPKKLVMEFLMGIDKEKLTKAWNDSLRNQCPKDCKNVIEGLGKMNSYMKNVTKKDRFEFVIHTDKVEVSIKGEPREAIEGADFAKAFLAVFIGPDGIDEGMTEGLLGKE